MKVQKTIKRRQRERERKRGGKGRFNDNMIVTTKSIIHCKGKLYIHLFFPSRTSLYSRYEVVKQKILPKSTK